MAAIEIISAVGAIFTALKNGKSATEKVVGAEQALGIYKAKTALYRTDGSMTRFLSNYIVEPTAIVSQDLANEEITEKLLEIEADIFTSFYLQVFEVLTKVNNIDAQAAIDLLSTDTTPLGSLKQKTNIGGALAVMGNEDFDYTRALTLSLDMPKLSTEARGGNNTYTYKEAQDVAQRLYNQYMNQNQNRMNQQAKATSEKLFNDWKVKHKNELLNASNIEAKKAFEKFKKDNPIAFKGSSVDDNFLNKNIPGLIQRSVNLELITNVNGMKHIISIPVLIKLHIIYTPISNIITMLKPNASDKSYANRLDEYKAGAISLSDLIFAGDLIRKYKQNKLDDKDKLLNMINNRTSSAYSKGVYGKGIGFENYYNILVITESDKIIIESHLKGKLKNDKYKAKLLEEAKALMVSIVDRDYERVTILTKDIHGKSDITFKALNKKGGKNDDLTDIFKSLVANKNPVI